VSFPKAKTPERLYNEVESYDLIITPDGPLASALNRQQTNRILAHSQSHRAGSLPAAVKI